MTLALVALPNLPWSSFPTGEGSTVPSPRKPRRPSPSPAVVGAERKCRRCRRPALLLLCPGCVETLGHALGMAA